MTKIALLLGYQLHPRGVFLAEFKINYLLQDLVRKVTGIWGKVDTYLVSICYT